MDAAVAVVGVPALSSAVWDDYRMRRVGGISSSVVVSSSSSLSRGCAVATHQHSWLVSLLSKSRYNIVYIKKVELIGQHTSLLIDRAGCAFFVDDSSDLYQCDTTRQLVGSADFTLKN
jgi:hypothetical protein